MMMTFITDIYWQILYEIADVTLIYPYLYPNPIFREIINYTISL